MSPLETTDVAERPALDPDTLTVDVDGFEGPLDMLLAMARTQKVDLRRISVLPLAEQYLAFVERARSKRIELAADYLVMAAWLAYLKSCLLLPAEEVSDEPSGEDMAARLALRLERLDAMRRASAELMARDRLGQDVFARGAPETVAVNRQVRWRVGLADLLRAYTRLGSAAHYRPLQIERPEVYGVEAAMERLRAALGVRLDWSALVAHLPADWLAVAERRRSAVASGFVASLELAKRGEVDLRQAEAFAPLMIRPRRAATAESAA
ncbi:MAG: ScpA family protein [Pseudomonadota bacterium]